MGRRGVFLEQVEIDHNGYPVRVDNLQLYMAPVAFRSEGEWTEGADVSLIDFSEHAQQHHEYVGSRHLRCCSFWNGPPSGDQHRHRSGILPEQPSAQCRRFRACSGRGRPALRQYEGKYALEPELNCSNRSPTTAEQTFSY